jgi:hypothetical protein
MTNDQLRDQLHEHAAAGTWWDPGGKPSIPAEWIRELVVTGIIPDTGAPIHAKGIRIRGVTLDGQLDFESAHLNVPMYLDDIEASEQIVLKQATGSWISWVSPQTVETSTMRRCHVRVT